MPMKIGLRRGTMKRRFVWLVVSSLVVLVLLVAACAPAPKEAAPTEQKAAPIEEKAPPAELPLVNIGETAEGMGVRVTISDAFIADRHEYYSQTSGEKLTKEASPGKVFLIVTVEIKNVGEAVRIAGGGAMRTLDSEGFDYAAVAYYGKDALQLDRYLIVGAEMKGKVLFQIPKEASGLKIRYVGVAVWEVK